MTIVEAESGPKLREITVSYSVGMKANIGNYESADAHMSRTERWDVSGMTIEKAGDLYNARMHQIEQELGEQIVSKYSGIKKGEI